MDGAVFFTTKHGSTADYAEWIGEATGLSVFDVGKQDVDPEAFDFLILDYNLPGSNGLALAREIASDETIPNAHLLLLTSSIVTGCCSRFQTAEPIGLR